MDPVKPTVVSDPTKQPPKKRKEVIPAPPPEDVFLAINAQKLSQITMLTFPIVRFADLPKAMDDGSMQQDIIDMMIEATENYTKTLEERCRVIKEKLDKIFHPTWHVVMGESFGFEVSYQPKCFLYIYSGLFSVLAFKCD